VKQVIILAVVLLTGCATKWDSGDHTQTQLDFARDKYQCMQASRGGGSFYVQGSPQFVGSSMAGYGLGMAIAQQQNFKACMEANGWVKE
jgi:hypothetical protein